MAEIETVAKNKDAEILILEAPHGFLIAKGKQTAIATDTPLDYEKAKVIVSDGEAFGLAELDQPSQIKTKEFDLSEWVIQHRITPRERRQWWPDAEKFYIYPIKNWSAYDGVKLYENGKIIDEPKLTAAQWDIVSIAKQLPKQITLVDDVIAVTDRKTFAFDSAIDAQAAEPMLKAAYNLDKITKEEGFNEFLPLYSLALVRNPRMRVSKKNSQTERVKQEGEAMPFAVRLMEDEYCVVNTDTEESMGCHETQEEAEAQLAALRINVEADENAMDHGKPKKRKPRKKEIEAPKKGFMDGLRNLSKSISDFLKSAEIEEKETDVTDFFTSDTGISQKQVNGELWHFTWSTNAFEDREGEIFSTKSLENYVSQAEKLEDRGHFNFWHINEEDGNFNTDFARKAWQGVIGRFLVEAGPYLDNDKGQAAKEFFNQYPNGHPKVAPEGWGCSPEYKYLPEERVTGVYENIWITRTSTLPLMRAANIWTKSSQLARSKMALTEDQLGAAIELFGGEDKVRSLIAEAEKRTEELETSNVAHKQSTTADEEPAQVELDLSTLAAEVGKQFSANLEPMAEALTALSEDMKAVKDRIEILEGKKEIIDRVESPRYVFTMRASESDETIVTEDNELKSKKPVEAQGNYDPKTITPNQFFARS